MAVRELHTLSELKVPYEGEDRYILLTVNGPDAGTMVRVYIEGVPRTLSILSARRILGRIDCLVAKLATPEQSLRVDYEEWQQMHSTLDEFEPFPVRDWRHEVQEDNTRQSYEDWVRFQVQQKLKEQ